MRLICPNCDAQYEVPDDVMPPEGRDVQCSNCNETWFQDHPDADPETLAGVRRMPPEIDDTDETASEPEPKEAAAPPAPPARRKMDPSIASVLREEAELEKKARRGETAGSVESQPDLGLNDIKGEDQHRNADARSEPVSRDAPAEPSGKTTAVSGSRRNQLPDIEEINSTLRSNNDRSPEEDAGQTAQIEARETRSFSRGFIVMVVLTTLLALLYAYAPEVAQAVPQTDPWLSAFVGLVDQGRVWLDARVEPVLEWLDTVTASGGQ